MTNERQSDHARTIAQWVVIGGSLLVLLGMTGFLLFDYIVAGHEPPDIVVKPIQTEVKKGDGGYSIPIQVSNRGDLIVENVWVQVSTTSEKSEPEVAQFEIDYLPGGKTVRQIIIFRDDPSTAALKHRVSYRTP